MSEKCILNNTIKKFIVFISAYLIFCISTLFHEWAHSLAAVIFGIKKNVFDIQYSYLPFLMGIEEKVNYTVVDQLPAWQSILISGAGLISNGLLAIISLIAITRCKKPISTLIVFTFAFFNISDWFNYLTIRTVFLRGDTANLVKYGFNYSILWVGGLLSSIFFIYMLFGPALKYTSNIAFQKSEDKKSFLKTVLIVFIFMQIGELYNDLVMYK